MDTAYSPESAASKSRIAMLDQYLIYENCTLERALGTRRRDFLTLKNEVRDAFRLAKGRYGEAEWLLTLGILQLISNHTRS